MLNLTKNLWGKLCGHGILLWDCNLALSFMKLKKQMTVRTKPIIVTLLLMQGVCEYKNANKFLMSDKEKENGSRVQKQSNEKSSKEKENQEKKQKEIDKELEVLRRWFETQGGCE